MATGHNDDCRSSLVIVPGELWRCPRCTLEKEPAEFYSARPGVAGAYFWCRSCCSACIEERRQKRLTAKRKELSKVTQDAA